MNYYKEKWCITLLKFIGMLFLGFIICFLILCIPQDEFRFEYTDLDNNKGIAKNCSYKFEHYKSGGQGSPVCELNDETVKQVKEYKYIYEKTVIPIKEILKEVE